jgi:regulator of sigma E protease
MSIDGLFFWLRAIPLLLVILVPLVLVHEIGHFIVARLVRMRVLEFGLGFPPRAKVLGHDHETEYTLNWLPIGGFVRLEGEEANSDDPRAFVNSSLPKQITVLVAGVAMNVVAAMVLLFVVAWVFNPIVQPTISVPIAGSPAEAAGLKDGDRLVSLNGQMHSALEFGTDSAKSWRDDLAAHAGQTITLVVADAQGVERTVVVKLNVPTSEKNWALGVQMTGTSLITTQGDPVQATGLAVTGTGRAMSLILVALGDLANRIVTHPTEGPPGVQGPVGIAADVGQVSSQPNALMLLLMMMAIISANLALVNILPFPPLDGGKIVIVTVKRIVGAQGIGRVETWAYVAGFALLLAFIGWITFFDIVRGGAP